MTRPGLNRRASAELAAQAWVEVSELLDLQLSPLGLWAIAALDPQPGETVVDVGCGAGQSVLQLAERVGSAGGVIGVDIAPRLLALASQRAAELGQARFVEADAQSVTLPDASADAVFSRFGVMAFADPVAAFANLRRILKPGGRLAFVCWRALAENELDLMPLQAAGLEAMADATPFSFADAAIVRATLEAAGFEAVTARAHDAPVSSGDADAMATVLLRVGPLGRILRETPALRATAEPRLRAALVARETDGAVALTAATWVVTGQRPPAS
ncbi:MAG: methyltransferase domain-containing protein [Caulobacterales bacterium]|nr:methyltransferase domain-containing protein [Caulobacterales bacterium]